MSSIQVGLKSLLKKKCDLLAHFNASFTTLNLAKLDAHQ
jgi:hypothetical protein